MNKSKRTYLLLPLASIIVVGAIVAIAIIPKINEINELTANIESENTRNTQLTTKRNQLLEIQTEEENLRANYTITSTALPDQKFIANLIMTMEALASQSDVSIGSLQVNPGTLVLEKPGISQNAEQLDITMTTQGSIDNIKTFLKSVYTGMRLINIRSINITTSQTETTQMQLTAQAFYKPRPILPQHAEEQLVVVTATESNLVESLEKLATYSPEGVTN